MTRFQRFLDAQPGHHEIRALEPPTLCACGESVVINGRCVACADRLADRLLELSRGELDSDDSWVAGAGESAELPETERGS